MDSAALERAFGQYPDVKLVVLAHLYGTPAKMDELRAVCDEAETATGKAYWPFPTYDELLFSVR